MHQIWTFLVTFLIIKPCRCTNFSNLFLEWNSTCFGQFFCPSSGVFRCTHSNGICHTGLLTTCKQDQDGTSSSCSQALSKPVWHIPLLCVQRKTPDDGQRNCPKHVEFHAKNKFEKLVHLDGFIIRNLTRCTVSWTSNSLWIFLSVILILSALINVIVRNYERPERNISHCNLQPIPSSKRVYVINHDKRNNKMR
jgi:hypothetical protein